MDGDAGGGCIISPWSEQGDSMPTAMDMHRELVELLGGYALTDKDRVNTLHEAFAAHCGRLSCERGKRGGAGAYPAACSGRGPRDNPYQGSVPPPRCQQASGLGCRLAEDPAPHASAHPAVLLQGLEPGTLVAVSDPPVARDARTMPDIGQRTKLRQVQDRRGSAYSSSWPRCVVKGACPSGGRAAQPSAP